MTDCSHCGGWVLRENHALREGICATLYQTLTGLPLQGKGAVGPDVVTVLQGAGYQTVEGAEAVKAAIYGTHPVPHNPEGAGKGSPETQTERTGTQGYEGPVPGDMGGSGQGNTAHVEEEGAYVQGQGSVDASSEVQGTHAAPESPQVRGFLRDNSHRHLPVIQTVQEATIAGHDPEIEEGLAQYEGVRQVLACDTCAIKEGCKHAQEGALCYYDTVFKKALPVRDVRSHKAMAELIIEADWGRTQRALMTEVVNAGGQLDPRVGNQLDAFMGRLERYQQLAKLKPASLRASITLEASGGAPRQSILSQLFGAALPVQDTTFDNVPARDGSVIEVLDAAPKRGT